MWGIVSLSYSNGSGTINFPMSFIDTKYVIVVPPVYISSSYPFEVFSVQKMSGTIVNVYTRKYPSLADKPETHDASWFAVGRWK